MGDRGRSNNQGTIELGCPLGDRTRKSGTAEFESDDEFEFEPDHPDLPLAADYP
jgi:hypothetical protein